MPIPTGTTNFPLGFETVTINTVTYKVDAVDISSETTRIINRPDQNGDASDFQIRTSGEKITGSITLQRADTSTAVPPSGTTFSYDYDRSGVDSTIVVTDVKVNRSKDSADIFEIGVLVDTYQG